MFSWMSESLLDREIDRALSTLSSQPVGSSDYAKTLESVIKLHKMQLDSKSSSVSKDTLAIVGANLLGILLIIRHEDVNVIASRAMNLVLKTR